MRRRSFKAPVVALAALLSAALFFTAPVQAAMIGDPWGHEQVRPWQTWADRSLIPLPPTPITVAFAACPSQAIASYACASKDALYVDPASPAQERQRLMLHEIGHWIDAHYLNDTDRDAFRRVAAAAGGPWLNSTEGTPSAGEQFAEAFSLCSIHRVWAPERYTFWLIYYKPGPVRHRRVCAWMRTLAQRWA